MDVTASMFGGRVMTEMGQYHSSVAYNVDTPVPGLTKLTSKDLQSDPGMRTLLQAWDETKNAVRNAYQGKTSLDLQSEEVSGVDHIFISGTNPWLYVFLYMTSIWMIQWYKVQQKPLQMFKDICLVWRQRSEYLA